MSVLRSLEALILVCQQHTDAQWTVQRRRTHEEGKDELVERRSERKKKKKVDLRGWAASLDARAESTAANRNQKRGSNGSRN